VVLITLILTVALLVGVHQAYIRLMVERPLVTELARISGLEAVELRTIGDKYLVNLKLGKVDDLAALYRQIEDAVTSSLTPGSFVLNIADRRTSDLENLYYRVHYYIEEALVQGNFSTAAGRIHAEARAVGVEDRFWVDGDYVYLELVSGDHYLYEVRPRTFWKWGEGAATGA
jgi:hypothetical protein